MQSNRLLSALSRKDQRELSAACDEVELCTGDILWEPLKPIRNVYFPLDCSIAQMLPVDSHKNLELDLIGDEGMLGLPLVLNMNISVFQALVQSPGNALRINAVSFLRVLERLPALRQQLNRYAYVSHIQLALTAACISFHSLDLRLARLLLMNHDRAEFDNFYLTHNFMAQILGVRRVGVTNAAGLLQKQRLLSYSRGDITILNRAGLEKASCECYQASRDMYDRVLV